MLGDQVEKTKNPLKSAMKRRKTKNSLRYAEPDSAHFAGIKSAVYVEDSD